MPCEGSIIQAHEVEKTYLMGRVRVQALKGVSFEVKKGELLGVTGPSGSGKSTLLNLIGLLDRPTAGSLSIDGMDILHLSEEERTNFRLNRLGFIFQEYALVPELTARENVQLLTMARGMTPEESRKRSEQILERVGLGDRMDHLPSELSGGEQQRVSIARAVVNEPSILLADEPCANLDTENSRNILELFASINREMNQTILMVSHEEWHRDYMEREIRLIDGKIDKDTWYRTL
jgi:putative ABC transport system ATP-binding protein